MTSPPPPQQSLLIKNSALAGSLVEESRFKAFDQ